VVFAVFTAVGLGMALPYLLLAAFPGTARFLPKPGVWMEYIRTLMGFLLAGAAIWLLYVLSAQVSATHLALIELGLLILALFIWLRHRVAVGPLVRRLAALGVTAAALGTILFALQAEAAGPTANRGTDSLIQWVDFDRREAEALAAAGRLVFVDVTADWCFTCKFNERLVLETQEVAEAFHRLRVVPMRADWTNRDDDIARYLAEFDRYGIPFYLLYRPGAEPHVFGELITRGEILGVLQKTRSAY
jgi:suppressor for copper-sensitivity B